MTEHLDYAVISAISYCNPEDREFIDAIFIDMDIEKQVHKLGGVVDFNDDKYMNELYRDMIIPWIKYKKRGAVPL